MNLPLNGIERELNKKNNVRIGGIGRILSKKIILG